jgi:hypothetical protein
MGPTALLPLRRKACWGFFLALKIRRLWPGANLRTWVPKVSTLPLDHRSRTAKEILGLTGGNYSATWENYIITSFMICTPRCIQGDSNVSIHGKNVLFKYKKCSIWTSWTSGQENYLYCLFKKKRHLSALLKRKIWLIPMYGDFCITLY